MSIRDQPGDSPVKVYVGQSPHTEKLGIMSAGLRDGAYRIVSGDYILTAIPGDMEVDSSFYCLE